MNIETEHLIIRKFEPRDRDDLCEYMLQRVNAEFEAYPDFTPKRISQDLEYRCNSDEFFAIELKTEHKVIGNIYLGKRDFDALELGYVLNENYQHMGYGSEAARAAVAECFRNGARRIFAECCPLNAPSWKTMEKIGMKREAHLRKNVSFKKDADGNPVYWDTYVYGLLREDM